VSKTRLEAFSDGVIAIIITIMVLEVRTPHGTTWAALRQDLPVLLATCSVSSSSASTETTTTTCSRRLPGSLA
jgi:Endosomal/lysosomal potassium channel TMEM175